MAETQHRFIGRFARVLAEVHGVEPTSYRLCEAGRLMLGAEGAALTLMTGSQSMVVAAATDDVASRLEDLQDVVGEGPSRSAFEAGAVQVADFTAAGGGEWTLLHEHVGRLGFNGVMVAVPLRPHDTIIGTLTTHAPAAPGPRDLRGAALLGVAIGTALLQDPAIGTRDDGLAEGWAGRAQVHQATGMIISQTGVRPEDALALLRGQAFANNVSMVDIAQQVVQRHINFRDFTIEGD
ncbi:MAG: ANTAR domain-containing protein [Aeromicrobium sp.]